MSGGARCAGSRRPLVAPTISIDSRDGEARTRTGDTTIFSRVLYQLSYFAEAGKG